MFRNGSTKTASPPSSLKEHKTGDEVEDDQKSTISEESGVPRADGALSALQLVAGNRVRHGSCAPEYLEELATRGASDGLGKFGNKKFKVMSGQEARLFFRKYLSEHNKLGESVDEQTKTEAMASPVVFAVAVWGGKIKCVDYYMTWRGIKKAISTKEVERRIDFLDVEFRQLVKEIDKVYRHISSLKMHENLSPVERQYDHETDPSYATPKARPSSIVGVLASGRVKGEKHQGTAEPPASATDSVMSLPLLNGIRNVPFSHRIPLRITNPDRLSMISDVDQESLPPPDSSDKPKPMVQPPQMPVSENQRSIKFAVADPPEFLIVFLGDKPNVDTNSWHGLERQSSIRSLPPERHSPWIPQMSRSESISQRYSPETDSTLSESWSNSPVVPMKNLGPFNPYYQSIPVIPGAQYINVGQMGSPAPTESPYLYSSPHLDSSPYIPWHLPIPSNISRAPSRAYSTASHSSPYLHTHAAHF